MLFHKKNLFVSINFRTFAAMKEFLQVLRRFVPPYKKYLILSIVFNILSAVLNIFSFAALIPILQILFQTGEAEAATSAPPRA